MGKSNAGLLLKIICNCSDCPRVVIDLAIKVNANFILKHLKQNEKDNEIFI